jgi:hypothetical protein
MNCGKDMGRYVRSNKKFCSDKCRVENHRKSNAQELYGQAMQAIGLMSKVPASERKKAIESLRILKKDIDLQLRALGDAEAQGYFDMISDYRTKRGL